MGKTKELFNIDLWGELIKLRKKGVPLSRKYIVDNYNLSDRVAYAYMFALNNHEKLVREVDEASEVGRLKSQLVTTKGLQKKLVKELQTLNSINNFLLALDKGVHPSYKISKAADEQSSYNDEITSISLLSDIHFEETVEASVVNYLNEYNVEIATTRTYLYFTRLLWLIKSLRSAGYNIKYHILGVLGDVITGYIHDELMENNTMSPLQASIAIEEILIDGIKLILNEGDFERLYVVMTRGNHGRTTSRKRFSTGYKNSYEYMIYHNIHKWFMSQDAYRDRVVFLIPDGEFAYMQVYDKQLCFSHGDHFNYRGGIGGVMIPFQGFIYKHNKIIDVDKYFIGHWHTSVNLNDGMINGSVIGYSPYAMGKSFAPEPPQQWLQLLDSKRGFTIATPIILKDW